MDLLSKLEDVPENILHDDGVVLYHDQALSLDQADDYLNGLLNKIEWKNDQVNLFGKNITTKRKVAWYADKPFAYTYSRNTKLALPWIEELLELKKIVEAKIGENFNSCLLNLYHNGTEGVSWHSDFEKELKKDAAIGSLSFGAERKFSFKHKKTKETVSLTLHHGSLLIMKGETQKHWLHCLPLTKKVNAPRVNLTFRSIIYKD
ncbi:MAG: alpha-ketoglutarate-dependent dioxygenase AlkB [Gammaproteobacteria bacterium]